MSILLKIILGPLYNFKNHVITNILLILAVFVLTIVTQFGGVLLWISLPLLRWIRNQTPLLKTSTAFLTFLILYFIVLISVIPLLAHLSDRVSLNWYTSDDEPLRPVNIFYCLLARNYVKPELKELLIQTALKMKKENLNNVVQYMDACFPFFDGYSLLPHLSHRDGKKIDISFYYRKKSNQQLIYSPPSPIGYWVYEQPMSHEIQPCLERNSSLRWNFDWLQKYYTDVEMDPDRTAHILQIICESELVDKIFIEPHLKERMKLEFEKIRFQGCYAARHDDHIHVQID
ncbi:hypothetical protein ACFLSX_00750 [Calditrichota bacterium]